MALAYFIQTTNPRIVDIWIPDTHEHFFNLTRDQVHDLAESRDLHILPMDSHSRRAGFTY